MAARKKAPKFEQSLEELEQLVEDMESGDLSLEESLASFEKGIKLTRECQKALTEAEQKVELLIQQGSQLETQAFDTQGDESE